MLSNELSAYDISIGASSTPFASFRISAKKNCDFFFWFREIFWIMCEFGRVDFSYVFQSYLSFIFGFFSSSIGFVCLFPKVSLSTDYHFTLSTYCNFGIFYWKKNTLCPLKSKCTKTFVCGQTKCKSPTFIFIDFFQLQKKSCCIHLETSRNPFPR